MLRQANNMILLVEDDEAEVLLVQEAISACHGELRLSVARDADDAMQWLADTMGHGREMPRLVLIDLKLPKLAGLAVLRTLRMETRLQDVPIVVFSEQHEPADVVLSYQIGANSFVKKPADRAEFTLLLSELADLGWLSSKGPNQAVLQPVSL